ncbi:hypothetical protein MHU86_5921 [Fragilaria crotonensis]|nr:hypothetical protein MHU86_5921 [Fragilaria crotonensis]
MWVGPSGERPLLPKDEGSGTMISAFICREHGLIRSLPPEILVQVNAQRAGQTYADPEAAVEILGSAEKRPLTADKSPFLVLFEYGENREGYWAYNHMVLQFEDAVDVLKLCTHPLTLCSCLTIVLATQKRPDGLNQHRMNRSYGGKAAAMRDTLITQEEGFLDHSKECLSPKHSITLFPPLIPVHSG